MAEPRSIEDLFRKAYPKLGPFKDACKLPKYKNQVAWARLAYAEQFDSDEEEEEPPHSRPATPPQRAKTVTPAPEPPTVWAVPDFVHVTAKMNSLESILRDLEANGKQLKAMTIDHEERVKAVNLVLQDTKQHVEALLVRLEQRSQYRASGM